jgi:hypothetical protein
MAIEDTVVSRITELIEEARSLQQGSEHGQVRSQDQAQRCKGWIAAALNIIQLVIVEPDSGYRKIVEELASRHWGFIINQGVGEISQILSNFLKDAQTGLISSVADRARAEVFDDFLDHAKSYLADNYSDRAGVIAGVVFENTLRRVCRKHHIEEQGVKLDKLISDLTSANVISPTKAKRARVAAHVRTKATHAQWEEFDNKDVQATIDFAEELILHHVEK